MENEVENEIEKPPIKRKGKNTTRSERRYIAEDVRKMKKWVEEQKRVHRVSRLDAKQRSALAYFLSPIGSGDDSK